MQTHPRLSKSGVELVKRFEGLRRTSAQLPAGGWTIGYGHTASARQGAQVSAEDAEALLLYDLGKVAQAVDAAVFTPVNQNQFDALTAFAFNVGIDNFVRSKVLKHLNEGSYLRAAAAIEMWRKADIHGDSIVVDALVRRRAAEKALFLTPPEGYRPTPTPVVRVEYDPAPDLAAAQPGLAEAAEVHVPMQGDVAQAELAPTEPYVEPPPVIVEPPAPAPVAAEPVLETFETATEIAARNVSAKLSQLFPDAPAPVAAPVVAIQPAPETLEIPTEPEPAPQPAETATPAPVFQLTPEPEAVAEPQPSEPVVEVAPEPAPTPSLFAAPPPRVYQPAVARFPAPEDTDEPAPAPVAEGFTRRYPTLAERAAAQPVIHDRPAPAMSLGVLVLGVFGAALFCGSLATMMLGRATLMNLALGLLGVVCMVPSGVKLLTLLFSVNDRGEEDEAV